MPPEYIPRVLSERVSRLFHGVVVVGAGLGCGGRAGDRDRPVAPSNPPPLDPAQNDPSPSVTPATQPGAPRPDNCVQPSQFSCESFAHYPACAYYGVDCDLAQCACDATRPAVPGDCEYPEQFRCEPELYAGWVVGCHCDESAPVQPGECARPQQFQCNTSDPNTTCVCNTDAPLDAGACPAAQRFSCQSYDPPTGCHCISQIILR
ncbi:MAG: hypothetical protein ABI895_35445 [Deltaproteobacteria bacterium]